MATISPTRTDNLPTTAALWKGAALTAFAAVLFPRVNAVIYDHEKIWHLDREAAVLAPIVAVVSVMLFAAIGLPAWRARPERRAVLSLVCGVLSVVGIVAFWISAPIMFGGLALTLGIESVRRAPSAPRRRLVVAGLVLGTIGVLAGAALWLVGA